MCMFATPAFLCSHPCDPLLDSHTAPCEFRKTGRGHNTCRGFVPTRVAVPLKCRACVEKEIDKEGEPGGSVTKFEELLKSYKVKVKTAAAAETAAAAATPEIGKQQDVDATAAEVIVKFEGLERSVKKMLRVFSSRLKSHMLDGRHCAAVRGCIDRFAETYVEGLAEAGKDPEVDYDFAAKFRADMTRAGLMYQNEVEVWKRFTEQPLWVCHWFHARLYVQGQAVPNVMVEEDILDEDVLD
ncbi:hypothetical protein QBC42DRAFT_291990 [Cladorrhinum samala]|uniref:Uncharacterized protein n=1 Tax=Cladorrhinum samala TaxID=585594 RepID=A0AAV9H8C7_9PEZI|nr:hypothetical protein QBC42DRAFT_291990 [Cladorrhinum samala]